VCMGRTNPAMTRRRFDASAVDLVASDRLGPLQPRSEQGLRQVRTERTAADDEFSQNCQSTDARESSASAARRQRPRGGDGGKSRNYLTHRCTLDGFFVICAKRQIWVWGEIPGISLKSGCRCASDRNSQSAATPRPPNNSDHVRAFHLGQFLLHHPWQGQARRAGQRARIWAYAGGRTCRP
jgi:hypothetical protein